MNISKAEKAKAILRILKKLYPDPPIPLDHSDPFTLTIAVLLSAQCTDKRVNEVTPGLFKLGSTPEQLARVPVAKIERSIRSCGLAPQKARAISELSKILVTEYGGQVPQSLEELKKLPGVGHKTASVVVIQAFGLDAFPVDTHIHRLATRWGLTSGKSVTQTEADLKQLFPQSSWNKLHLQMIYFGREYCPARGHTVEGCPICSKFGVCP